MSTFIILTVIKNQDDNGKKPKTKSMPHSRVTSVGYCKENNGWTFSLQEQRAQQSVLKNDSGLQYSPLSLPHPNEIQPKRSLLRNGFLYPLTSPACAAFRCTGLARFLLV